MNYARFSTFELAEMMLQKCSDWILVRVKPYGAVFEDQSGEFSLSRREMISNLRQRRYFLGATLTLARVS
jgi:hypothetical protein